MTLSLNHVHVLLRLVLHLVHLLPQLILLKDISKSIHIIYKIYLKLKSNKLNICPKQNICTCELVSNTLNLKKSFTDYPSTFENFLKTKKRYQSRGQLRCYENKVQLSEFQRQIKLKSSTYENVFSFDNIV